jgi:hypothetical protein
LWRDELRERICFSPRRVRLRMALAAYALQSLRLHSEFGYAKSSDFVREHLGLSTGLWFDLVHAGALLTQPAFRCALRARRLEFSALVLLGRRFSAADALQWLPLARRSTLAELRAALAAEDDAAPPVPSSSVDTPEPVHLRLRLPAAVAEFLDESHELCSALVGHELSQPQALHYLLAEASSELSPPEPTAHSIPAELRPVQVRPSPNIRQTRADGVSLRKPHDRHALAVKLAKRLRALTPQELTLQLEADDALLEALQGELHHAFGDRRFVDFAQRELDLAPSTTDEKLLRARQRAREHPIEVARASGRITQIQASLLHGLRGLGIPRSALAAWIRFAAQHTIRALKLALAWVRRIAQQDLSQLYKKDYRPPSLADIRTSDRPLRELALEFELPPPGFLQDQPLRSTPLSLEREDHAVLLDLTHALDQQPKRTPLWWKFLQILCLAREGMAQLAEASAPPPKPQRQILERDRYRCQFPGCSERRVEVHHIQFKSQGGSDDPSNLLCLCPAHHHHGVHARTIRIHGQASPTQEHLIVEAGLDRNGHALLRYQGERLVFSGL